MMMMMMMMMMMADALMLSCMPWHFRRVTPMKRSRPRRFPRARALKPQRLRALVALARCSAAPRRRSRPLQRNLRNGWMMLRHHPARCLPATAPPRSPCCRRVRARPAAPAQAGRRRRRGGRRRRRNRRGPGLRRHGARGPGLQPRRDRGLPRPQAFRQGLSSHHRLGSPVPSGRSDK